MKTLLTLIAFCLFYWNSFSQETAYVEGELIVMLEPGFQANDVVVSSVEINGKTSHLALKEVLSDRAGIYLFEFNINEVASDDVLRHVKNLSGVMEAQFNHYVQQRAVPSDPQFNSQWHHIDASDNDIDTDLAWDITTGGNTGDGHNVVACIVEAGGINWNHPDLMANHWTNSHEIANNGIDDDLNGRIDDVDGWFHSGGNDNIPSAPHGTACMGMMGAVANNANGGAGVCWNTDLMAVAFSGTLTESNVITAYDYPYDMRVQYNNTNGALGAFVTVISSSWGIDNANPAFYPIWCAFYDQMGGAGIINCVATTNLNQNVDVVGDMPSGCTSPYVISVTATNNNDVRTFSGFGSVNVDLGAPGEDVWIPNEGGYASQDGTSFATPCVAGAVALMYSIPCLDFGNQGVTNPAGTATLIRNAILNGVDVVADLIGDVATNGRLNVRNSMNILMATCPPPRVCFNLEMTDAYGDGWNGANYYIYNSGGFFLTSGTLSAGLYDVHNLCLGEGCFTMEISGGSFPSEVGWTLSGVNEGTISGGAPGTITFSVGSVVHGCTDFFACNYYPLANCDDGSCVYCPNNCIAISMSDGFGDGWNGGYYTVVNNDGIQVSSGTIDGPNGQFDINAICLDDGCYTLNLYGGSFPSEIGWELNGVNEGTMYGAAPGSWSFTVGTVVIGCTEPFACNYNPAATCDDGSCTSCLNNCLSFTMMDSFGDGWNGAAYSIQNASGVVVWTGTMDSGDGSFDINSICLESGCFTLFVTGGSFPSEISWILEGANEGTYTFNGPAVAYFSVGAVIENCMDPAACNYDPLANCSENSCVYCSNNCIVLTLQNPEGNFGDFTGLTQYVIYDSYYAVVASGYINPYGEYATDVIGVCLDDGCYTLSVYDDYAVTNTNWTLSGVNEGTLSGVGGLTNFTVGSVVSGCTDIYACNYNPSANCESGNCCYANCVTFEMYDSYGDGWNGAQFSIVDFNNNLVSAGTLSNALYGVVDLCLNVGCYTLSITAGSFPAEISWVLNGVSVGSLGGGAPTSISFEVGTPLGGCTDPTACNYLDYATCNDGTCVYCFNNCVAFWMLDEFGDGWNGASYSVMNSAEEIVSSGTMNSENGAVEIDAFCLDDGCYSLSISAGSFPSEVIWYLIGANEGPQSGGAPVTLNFSVGTVVNGCMDISAANYNPLANCEDGSCATCVGDFDNNGVINISDLLLFMASFGCLSSCGEFDLDNNGVVNTSDLLIFMAVFGDACP